MNKVIVINGSPRKDKGNTGLLLKPFVEGMIEAGADVEECFASEMKVEPCSCNRMYCWNDEPGVCCIKDAMQDLYPRLAAANILILATPMYIPFPGDMQNMVNRLCPLIEPKLAYRNGRTRASLRASISIRNLALVATSGWWEKENLDTLTQIARELAADMAVEFSGAIIRPHAYYICSKGVVTPKGQAVLEAAKLAGRMLIEQGQIPEELIDSISQPLILAEQWIWDQSK